MGRRRVVLAPCKLAKGKPCSQCTDLQRFRSKHGRHRNTPPSREESLRTLYSAINHSHDPFIHKLPLEIASNIFSHCLIYPHSKPYSSVEMAAPLILGAVCQTWRQIAWSTPELWNSMFFEFWIDQCDDDALRMELVKEWLARSGDLPLNICTQCRRRKAQRAPVASLFPFVDILNSYANRWQVLNLHAPSALLARFDPSSTIPKGSGLAELTIEPADYSLACPVNLMSATTTLRKLTIVGIPPSLVHVHFDQIMHLSTVYLSSDKCLWLLRLTPRLEECTFTTMDRAQRDLPSDHFAVPNLRQLAFKGSWERRLDVFLDKLDLPSLQRLEISAKVDLEPPLDLASHFARWHCPLKMLSLSCCETRGMDMKDMLSQITTLEYLKLSLSEGSSVACDVL